MFQAIRNSKLVRVFTILIAYLLIIDPVSRSLFALTSGPSQPEFAGIGGGGSENMVDPFTGDFNYSIPLFDINGKSVALNYNSEVTMEQEASWVGLGWSLNTGAITRNMRGIPDDFSGDLIRDEHNVKPMEITSFNVTLVPEAFAIESKALKDLIEDVGATVGLTATYRNYNGWSLNPSMGLTAGFKSSVPFDFSVNARSTDEGMVVTPNIGLPILDKMSRGLLNLNTGISFNTVDGLKGMGFSSGLFGGIGTVLNFSHPTYNPVADYPYYNFSYGFDLEGGVTTNFFSGFFVVGGTYSEQGLMYKKRSLPAYGYLNSQNASGGNVMLDYNREKDGVISDNTGVLPQSYQTYDIFSVNGFGMNGSFRAHRNDVGCVYDYQVQNFGNDEWPGVPYDNPFNLDVSGGIELGAINIVDVGLDISLTRTKTTTGGRGNLVSNYVYKGEYQNNEREAYYFKMSNEMAYSASSEFIYDNYGKSDPLAFKFNSVPKISAKLPKLQDQLSEDQSTFISSHASYDDRQNRGTMIQTFTRDEAIKYYPELYTENNAAPPKSGHHIGLIIITAPDGTRYVYGETIYNTHQEDVTFNTHNNKYDLNEGWVKYSETNASVENTQGIDNYYKKTVTPPYAHTYLLTAILSHDYVDAYKDGPTEDDYGNWTKFTYESPKDQDGHIYSYRYRTPYWGEANKANFIEGEKFKETDNKGTYSYGVRQLKYLKTVKTRTQKIVFETSSREDGCGVVNEFGARDDNNQQHKLDKIEIFAIGVQNGSKKHTKIKSIHFKYDYSLCGNVPNNTEAIVEVDGININSNRGKLTLKQVYILNGTSSKGTDRPYEFTYNSGSLNPDYNMKAFNRWGTYKPAVTTGNPTNAEYPYIEQNNATQVANAQNYIQCWKLKQIDLPTGGSIEVEYESDEYAWVQNRPAAQMFKVAGISTTEPLTDEYLESPSNDLEGKYYLIVELVEPLNADEYTLAEAKDYFKDHYLAKDGEDPERKLQDNFYFRFRTNIQKPESARNEDYAYVSGYAEIDIDGCGVTLDDLDDGDSGNDVYTHAYIKLKSVNIKEGQSNSLAVNPISKTAWQYTRLNAKEYAFGDPIFDGDDKELTSLKQELTNILNLEFLKLHKNINKNLLDDEFGKYFKIGESWVRLYNPNGHKLGGGSRVKSITTIDNWDDMTNSAEDPSAFRTVYEYDLPDGTSSGVASWEPGYGADENPFKLPLWNKEEDGWYKRTFSPDERFYQELPIGETQMPSATVGYSKVTMYQVPLDYNGSAFVEVSNMTTHKTGKTVKEFYTAKDFPVKVERTDLHFQNGVNSLSIPFASFRDENAVATQGFTIILNDMHGKPKSEFIYPEGAKEKESEAVSGVVYHYQKLNSTLDSEVKFADKTGDVTEGVMGMDVDITVDYRYNKAITNSGGANVNGEFTSPSIPFIFGMLNYSRQTASFECATTTKVINQKAIVEEVVAYDLGSKVSTKNMVYDKVTGQVILNETINEYNDKLYTLTYPAYWAYKGMEESYKSAGMSFDGTWASSHDDYLTVGDEVWIDGELIEGEIYTYVDNGNPDPEYIDFKGDSYSPFADDDRVIVRPGRRNILSASAGSIVTRTNPLVDDDPDTGVDYILDIDVENSEIVNATATEYNSKWRNYYYEECSSNLPVVTNFSVQSGYKGDNYSDYYASSVFEEILNKTINGFPNSVGSKIDIGENSILSNNATLNCRTCLPELSGDANYLLKVKNPMYYYAQEINTLLSSVSSSLSIPIDPYFPDWLNYYDAEELITDGTSLLIKKYDHQSDFTDKLSFYVYNGYDYIYNRYDLSIPYDFENINEFNSNEYYYSCLGQGPILNYSTVNPYTGRAYAYVYADVLRPNTDKLVVKYMPNSPGARNVFHYYFTNAIFNSTRVDLTYAVKVISQNSSTFVCEIHIQDPEDNSTMRTQEVRGKALNSATIDYANIDYVTGNFQYIGTFPTDPTYNDMYLEVHGKDGSIMYIGLKLPEQITLVDNEHYCTSINSERCYVPKQTIRSYQPTDYIKLPKEYISSWSPISSYKYKAKRTRTEITGYNKSTDIRVDGVYDIDASNQFNPFWTFATSSTTHLTPNDTNWVWTKGVSEKNPFGAEIEEINALGVYSSAFFDWTRTRPIAVAQNARVEQIFNDNFEDYYSNNFCPLTYPRKFIDNINERVESKAHTGMNSMYIMPSDNISIAMQEMNVDAPIASGTMSANARFSNAKSDGTNDLEHIQYFAPYKSVAYDQPFICTFWVSTDDVNESLTTFSNVTLDIKINGVSLSPAPTYSYGAMVEGWLKVDAFFNIPSNASGTFDIGINNGTTEEIYVDDIRVHPPDAMMKTYVYNQENGLLMAELDENNYATIYEYDEAMNMVRIKRETERGLMTIKESRIHYKR